MSLDKFASTKKNSPEEENSTIESIKKTRNTHALIFVPGVTEGIEIYRDVARQLEKELQERGEESKEEKASLESTRLYFVSTHPEEESQHQDEITKSAEQSSPPPRMPIMGIISNSEKHNTLENRVNLVTQAIQEASIVNGTEKIVLVGHSAGGFATLAGVMKEIQRRNNLSMADRQKEELPQIHAVLIAPVLPREVWKLMPMEKSFIGLVARDFFKKLFTHEPSYLSKMVRREDIVPDEEDLKYLLGPMNDAEFEKLVLEYRVPLSGGEGFDIMQFPQALQGLKASDMPENVRIDIIVPNNDRWINRLGQIKLGEKILKKLMGLRVTTDVIEGSHLPAGEQDAADKIVEHILEAQEVR